MLLRLMILGLVLASVFGASARAGEVEARLDAMMRAIRLSLAACLAVLVAGFADNPIDARREDRARHLLMERVETWVADIAGFNRRNAICDRAAAEAAATFDAAHRTAFKRTLGWRFDAAGTRWVPAPPKQAEVTLVYSGPVRSGTVTIDGKALSFCRAEAPDKVETWWVQQPDGRGGVNSVGTSYALPTLAPGLDAPKARQPSPDTGAPTPRGQVEARIAKAAAMLAQDVDGIDAFVTASRAANACEETKAREMAKSWAGMSRASTRMDGAVQVEVRGPSYFGALKEGDRTIWVCGSVSPKVTIKATATWQAEGDNQLFFTVDAQAKVAGP